MDQVPARSPAYLKTPPKVKLLKALIDDLLKRGAVRRRKFSYTSPTILVLKAGDGFCLVVDCSKVNAKICFIFILCPR
jgi:hypothetical protein